MSAVACAAALGDHSGALRWLLGSGTARMLRLVPNQCLREANTGRSTRVVPTLALALVLGLAYLGCADDGSPSAASASKRSDSTAVESAATARAKTDVKTVSSRGTERPLPGFEGRTLTGERLSISSLIGKRLVLFFFNPEVAEANVVTRAVTSIAAQRAEFNFNVVGIAVGSNPVTTRAFVAQQGIDFPVLDDSRGRITAKLGLSAPVMLLSVDSEGFLGELAMRAFLTEPEDAWKTIANQIRKKLRIASPDDEDPGALDQRPFAPAFETPTLAGGETFELASLKGKPLILIFFLHTCPHCHSAFQFLQEQLAGIPKEKRPEVVGVSISNRAGNLAVRAALREEKIELEDLTLLADPTGDLAGKYGVFAGVPVIHLIDRNGRIVQRIQGWEGGRETALLRMQLAQLAGTRVPMLLNPKGFTGADACGVCHVNEYNSWRFTSHSAAYDTLVTHGKAREAGCVSCHVAGFDQPGGFTMEEKPHHLENVSCENCHGRGGPHLSPGFVAKNNYETACLVCHNKEHSLGFEYASFLPRISHRSIAALSTPERVAMLASRGKPRDVLPQSADHVGSEACRSCHPAEFATWSQSGHAHAGETLKNASNASAASDQACLACHTTGFGRAGGFQASASLAEQEDMGRVGCESCHAAGGDHVKPGAPKLGSIVSLGDKCDSCVILQICGRCHDEANDAGFEFQVEAKIDKQRHGTIEAGTGKPIGSSAAAHRAIPIEGQLAQAFSLLEAAGRIE